MLDQSIGKLPPQSLEAEKAVLGAIILQKNALLPVLNLIQPDSFYHECHGKVYKAILSLYTKNQPYDLISLVEELRKQGSLAEVGGPYFLTELTNKVANGANVSHHAAIVEECYLRREIIRLNNESANNSYDDTNDVFESLMDHQTKLFSLLSHHNGRSMHSIGSIIKERMVEYAKEAPDGLTGVGTGFTELDKITGGFQNSDLIIVAARPAMGKTAFAMQIAKNASMIHNVPVGIFELEMSKERLTDRLVSNQTDVYQDKLLKRELTDFDLKRINDTVGKLIETKIFIDDSPNISIMSMRSKALQLKQKENMGLMVVDYLQLMQGSKNNNREQVISEISRGLKCIAKELNIPVIALSQLSRAVESRPGNAKRPMLSDLRESGSIEQDADMVIFLYRPEYYGIEVDEDNESTIGMTEAIIAKHRNGVCDTVKMDFNGAFMRFKNWNEVEPSIASPFSGIHRSDAF